MSQSDFLMVGICALVGSFCATRGSMGIAHFLKVHALPHERSLHEGTIPRLGGLGIFLACVLGLSVASLLYSDTRILWSLVCLSILGGAGIYDDWMSSKGMDNHRLTALIKLAAQMLAALIAVIFIFQVDSLILSKTVQFKLGWVGFLLTWFWLIGMTNFFNFMDGSNGMAGGTAVVIGVFAGYWNLMHGQVWAVILSFVVLLAALGFLPFNFPKAKTFMGDCGSLILGFCLALVALPAAQGMMIGQLNPWLLILILSPFIIDAGLTLLRRMIKRENIFHAHSSHIFQKIIKGGHSHVEVALLYWNLAIFFNFLALWFFR